MDEFLQAINEALKKQGVSASAASQAAVGHPAGIKNLMNRRGSDRAHPIENLMRIAETLDLELYLGPRRNLDATPEPLADDNDFVKVNRYDVVVSAGDGLIGDNVEPLAPIAFRAAWMRERGLVASSCCVLTVAGDSMLPTLHDGDLLLIDQSTRPIKSMEVYAFIDGAGGAKVKRLEKTNEHLLVKSDNPAHATAVLAKEDANSLNIVGRVVWSGHEF